ncbi:MAG: DUF1015 family protein [Actinomycetota bacterium]
MAEIAPFEALRFDPAAVGELADVVAPPYDVISPSQRDALESWSPYNVVRLILPRDAAGGDGPGRYGRARAQLDEWRANGIVRPDDEPSLTVYEQRYTIGGVSRVQRGLLAAVVLEGLLPHERTYDDIVADRLDLLRATETNLDPIFCVYDGQDAAAHDAVERVCAREPLARFVTEDDGIEHLVWKMTDAEPVARALEKATLVIADGHHRWRTALRYRDERRAVDGPGPWDAQMMFLVDASRWGPALLPIHRVLEGLDADDVLPKLRAVFDIEDAPHDDPEALAASLGERRAGGIRTFAMFDARGAWFLTLKDPAAEREAMPADRSEAWRDLDVAVLHHLVFDRLLGGLSAGFAHSATEAAHHARAGGGLAFLLAPMPFDAVRAVAETGEAMPQKSTYFVPKPKTGIALRSLR